MRHLALQTFLGLAIALVCGFFYFGLQRVHLGSPWIQPPCPFSERLPFAPEWTPVYLSMFLLVALAWFAQPDIPGLRRFACGLLAIEAIGWAFFFFMPTLCPRPAVSSGAPWLYLATIGIDRPLNCFPCLHSALTVFAGGELVRVIPRQPRGMRCVAIPALLAWSAGILLSILLLRQHTALDLAAGILLGAGGLALGHVVFEKLKAGRLAAHGSAAAPGKQMRSTASLKSAAPRRMSISSRR
jgi:hypothetical protein